MTPRRSAPQRPATARTGLARALSKLGFCSRSQAWTIIQGGQVRVNGTICRDPERPTDPQRDHLEVGGQPVQSAEKLYLALNKPRGLVTTASDERGRPTVFRCFDGAGLPFLSPVGRLDQASEGLVLFTNDTAWAARLTDPASHLDKTYHLQINYLADEALTLRLREGQREGGEWLAAKEARVLRVGEKNSWLEIVLDEGRNRHLRRLLDALDIAVLRLVRVAIGPLPLGTLGKSCWRHLTADEVAALRRDQAVSTR